jgi:hypothetical protein
MPCCEAKGLTVCLGWGMESILDWDDLLEG